MPFQVIFADSLDVSGFKHIPNDISATRFARYDANDQLCALIKVISDIDELGFESNRGIVGDIEKKGGEYWIYVSPGERRLSIWGRGLMKYKFVFPLLPKSGKVYQIIVTRKGSVKADGFTTGFILLKTEPPGAKIWIDNEYRGLTPFQQEMPAGFYNYKVEKELFYPEQGNFLVKINNTITENVVLKPHFGSLEINTYPDSGAMIILDGVPTKFKTPHIFDTVSSGNHTVSLVLDLYEPVDSEVTINDNEKSTLNITMKPLFGKITITSNPSADIYIDSVLAGNDAYSGVLTKGMHTVVAKRENYYIQSRKLNIKTGSSDSIFFELKPITGSLSVVTTPPEAEIYIDGKLYGTSPKIIDKIIIGEHIVKLKKHNYATVTKKTEIKENHRTILDENLSNFREIMITSEPSEANLSINGREIGTTPEKLTTHFGENSITLSKKGYIELHKNFTVTEEKEEYSFELVSDEKAIAQMDFKKFKKIKNIFLGATVVTAGVGAYFAYSANKHYEEYKDATEDATDLHNLYKSEDVVWPIAFGLSGVCAAITVFSYTKQIKAKKKINVSAVALYDGAFFKVVYNF